MPEHDKYRVKIYIVGLSVNKPERISNVSYVQHRNPQAVSLRPLLQQTTRPMFDALSICVVVPSAAEP
jgi:hypothetical protein